VYCWRALLPSTTHGLPRPDVVIGSSVHPFAAVAGRLLARRFRVPFIFEVRDLWPQTLVDMGRLSPNSFSVRLMRWMERWLYRRADRIVVLLPLAADYIVPLGIPMERIVYVPNGVEPGSPPPDATPRETFDLMYFGAHGQANGLDNIVRAMKFVSDKDGSRHIRLRMIGDGPMKASLVATARELGLQNVVFEPPVPKSAIPDIAATADAFIFNLMDVPVFRYGISSNKLFDFLAASRPIIFCCTSGNNPVADASAGITVAPNDPEALSRAIMTMAATPIEERSRMGRSGRSYVEANHSFGSLARRLSAVLDEAIRSSR